MGHACYPTSVARILITGPFDEDVWAELETKGMELMRRPGNISEEELESAIAEADAYVMGGSEVLTPNVLNAAKRLRIIIFPGAQPETYLADDVNNELERRHISLESTPGVATNAVAEMTCGLILSCLRRIPQLVQDVQNKSWTFDTGMELAGKTLGIYGMGKTGYAVAKRLSGFELGGVLYSDVVQSDPAENDFRARRVELADLFAKSDVVSIHAPLNAQTKESVGDELLRLMKRDAVLVNTARPWIVKPDDLMRALAEGWIRCAAFDGYYVEGYPFTEVMSKGDPYGLLGMRDRFLVTSHQAFNTREAITIASLVAVDKLERFFERASQVYPAA